MQVLVRPAGPGPPPPPSTGASPVPGHPWFFAGRRARSRTHWPPFGHHSVCTTFLGLGFSICEFPSEAAGLFTLLFVCLWWWLFLVLRLHQGPGAWGRGTECEEAGPVPPPAGTGWFSSSQPEIPKTAKQQSPRGHPALAPACV